MNRSRLLTVAATLAAAALAGACGDTAPTAPAAAPSLGWKQTSNSGSSKTVTFTVYPGLGSMVNIDEHRIVFEANAICDMQQSSYGPEYWDAACPLTTRPVKITATASHDAEGRPMVDFQPALRFHPSAKVTLYLRDKDVATDPDYRILWVGPDGALVDESLTDPSVATRTGPNGFKYRRVKHFSTYTVSTGRSLYNDYLRGAGGLLDIDPTPLGSGHVVATGAVGGSTLQQ